VNAADGDEQGPPKNAQPLAASALLAPVPGETLAYFFTSDNEATVTVIFLLNTDSVSHAVPLRGYSHDGTLAYSLEVTLLASSMRRSASDAIVANAPPSWSGPSTGNTGGVDPIIVNLTDFTYYASVSLPKGVRVDGYTIFNAGTGTVDPRLNQGAIPLRFMINGRPTVVPIIF
jgi:hypothetical protein